MTNLKEKIETAAETDLIPEFLKDAKTGDPVFDVQLGKGYISKVETLLTGFEVTVLFEGKRKRRYNAKGMRLGHNDRYPSLYSKPFYITVGMVNHIGGTVFVLKRDTPVFVQRSPSDEWVKRHYAYYDEEHGMFAVYANGGTSFTNDAHVVRFRYLKDRKGRIHDAYEYKNLARVQYRLDFSVYDSVVAKRKADKRERPLTEKALISGNQVPPNPTPGIAETSDGESDGTSDGSKGS